MECLCPCYTWLKPWFCSITSTTPNTEEEEDDLEDDEEEENAIHDHQLEELQRRLDKEGIPLPAEDSDLTSINPASANSDKITVVLNDHHPISDNQHPSKIYFQFDIFNTSMARQAQGSGGDCDPRQKYQVWFFAFSGVSSPRRNFGTNSRPVTRSSPLMKILKHA